MMNGLSYSNAKKGVQTMKKTVKIVKKPAKKGGKKSC